MVQVESEDNNWNHTQKKLQEADLSENQKSEEDEEGDGDNDDHSGDCVHVWGGEPKEGVSILNQVVLGLNPSVKFME